MILLEKSVLCWEREEESKNKGKVKKKMISDMKRKWYLNKNYV